MDKLVTYYRRSLRKRIATLNEARLQLASDPSAKEVRETIYRIAHSLKGTGSSYGFPAITAAAEILENSTKAGEMEQPLEALLEILQRVVDQESATEPEKE